MNVQSESERVRNLASTASIESKSIELRSFFWTLQDATDATWTLQDATNFLASTSKPLLVAILDATDATDAKEPTLSKKGANHERKIL